MASSTLGDSPCAEQPPEQGEGDPTRLPPDDPRRHHECPGTRASCSEEHWVETGLSIMGGIASAQTTRLQPSDCGSGTGIRNLNLAVNRSALPVQKWRSEFRCVLLSPITYHGSARALLY